MLKKETKNIAMITKTPQAKNTNNKNTKMSY